MIEQRIKNVIGDLVVQLQVAHARIEELEAQLSGKDQNQNQPGPGSKTKVSGS